MATLKKDLAEVRRERASYLRRVKILEAECLDLQAALEAEEEAENNAVEMEDLTEADGDITIRWRAGSTDCGGLRPTCALLDGNGVFVAVMQRTIVVECRLLFA